MVKYHCTRYASFLWSDALNTYWALESWRIPILLWIKFNILCSQDHTVSIDAYGVWASKAMILSLFRRIITAYHTEFGESVFGDKYYQLRFLIRCINQPTARTFYLGPNTDFDEGGVATHSCFCFIWKYNKDKPEIHDQFFSLADIKYYFVWHIDMYQGKNAWNIDIYHREKKIPTMTNAVINVVLDSNISNYHYGERKLLLDNRYACTEIFEILGEEMNIIGGGNRKKEQTRFSRRQWMVDI